LSLYEKLWWQNLKLKLRKNPKSVYCFGSDQKKKEVQEEEICSGLLSHVREKGDWKVKRV
jgi:hypothetical protein